MNKQAIEIKSSIHGDVIISAIPGHFVTSHSHINYYIDITRVKHDHTMDRNAALNFADYYSSTTLVDTIICMDGSEVIGSFLARELTKTSYMQMNSSSTIYVVTPEFNTNGQMIFRDNIQDMIAGKRILLLIASITTGKTAKRSLECLDYYGGNVIGISAIFSTMDEVQDIPVKSIFQKEDIPDYQTYSFRDCPFCKENHKIDALANSYGYSKI